MFVLELEKFRMDLIRLKTLFFLIILAAGCCIYEASATELFDEPIVSLDKEAGKLFDSGRYEEALRAAKEAARLGEERYGLSDGRVGWLIGKVGLILRKLRRDEAGDQFQRAIAILEDALSRIEKEKGPDHLDAALEFARIGWYWFVQERFQEAEPFFQRALAIREKALGPEHKDVALALNWLGRISWIQGRAAESEQLFKRGIAITEKAEGRDSPELQNWLDILANFYESQQRWDEAQSQFMRELAIVEKAHGPEDPAVAKVLFSLAGAHGLWDEEQFRKSEHAYQRGLAIMKKAKGLDDIELREWHDKLGDIAQRRGLSSEAQDHFRRSLDIVEKAKGPEHVDLVSALDNLASAYFVWNHPQYQIQETLLRRGLAILEKARGPSHIDLVDALNRLASSVKGQRHLAEAEAQYKRTLAILEKAKGDDHPDLVGALNHLAEINSDQKKNVEAEALYRRALTIVERTSDTDETQLVSAIRNLANFYWEAHRHEEAEPLYRRALAVMEKSKSADDFKLSGARGDLARYYQDRRQFAKAEALYQAGLIALEQLKGRDSPELVNTLDGLASVYAEQPERRADAEKTYMRSLVIREKTYGVESPKLIHPLQMLGMFYDDPKLREPEKAAEIIRRIIGIAEKSGKENESDLRRALADLGNIYDYQKRFGEAEAVYRRVLAILENDDTASALLIKGELDTIAFLAKRQGRYREAEELLQKAVRVIEKEYGPESNETADELGGLIRFYDEQFRYAAAEPLMRRVLAIAEKLHDPKADESRRPNLRIHAALRDLGRLLADTNRQEEAEALYRRALAIAEQSGDRSSLDVVYDLDNLSGVLTGLGRDAEAEPLLRRAKELAERINPGDQSRAFNSLALWFQKKNRLYEAETLFRRALADVEANGYLPHITTILMNFGSLLDETGRSEEAERMLRRALEIEEIGRGTDHPELITYLNNLAVHLDRTQRSAEAAPLMRRSLAIAERTYGPEHPRVARRLGNLALVLLHTKDADVAEVEKMLRRALSIDEKNYGRDDPRTSSPLNGLAQLLMKTGRFAECEMMLRRALELDERNYGSLHPETARDLSNLALIRSLQGDWAGASALHRRALPASKANDAPLGREGWKIATRKQDTNASKQYSRAIYRANEKSASALNASFEAAQQALRTDAGEALAQMSARFAKGKGPLAKLVRERQNLVNRRRSEDKRLLDASGRVDFDASGKLDFAKTNALRASIAELDASLERLDATLGKEFPDYAEFTNPKPLSVAQAQSLLAPREALIVFLDVAAIDPLPGETLVWVITKKASVQRSVALDSKQLAEHVMALRCGLDEALWRDPAGASKCEGLLKATRIDKGPMRGLLPFDLGRAHDLYETLLGPDKELLKDKHLLLVPSGSLTRLPFGVLLTASPTTALPDTSAEYSEAAWLGARQPIRILPSVASLNAPRRVAAKSGKGTRAYLGIGNPLLDGEQTNAVNGAMQKKLAEAALSRQRCSRAVGTRLALATDRQALSFDKLFRGAQADIEQIRLATPLPETADEVCDAGHRFKASDSDILLGDRAREGIIKGMSESGRLADYRILHFATHGALAGDVKNTAEPGLILTPPAKDTAEQASLERDDGYLSASEIATLKLDADWVILSACNTAGSASETTEALSGLARAFFYAGARALLVSHWAVDSDAAVKIVSVTFERLAQHPELTGGEALQQSMRKLIKAEGREAHPAYWAPFILVGNQGRARDAGRPLRNH
jgi:CHAT domain-containing protein/tetratricopeptide (TPR) repeat protein